MVLVLLRSCVSLICERANRTDRVEGRDIYHNEDIIEISIVARVTDGAGRRLIVDSITGCTGQESETSSLSKSVISALAPKKKKRGRAIERVSLPPSRRTCPFQQPRRRLYPRKLRVLYINWLLSTMESSSGSNELRRINFDGEKIRGTSRARGPLVKRRRAGKLYGSQSTSYSDYGSWSQFR